MPATGKKRLPIPSKPVINVSQWAVPRLARYGLRNAIVPEAPIHKPANRMCRYEQRGAHSASFR